jgi:hypothetical protein
MGIESTYLYVSISLIDRKVIIQTENTYSLPKTKFVCPALPYISEYRKMLGPSQHPNLSPKMLPLSPC